MECKYLIVGGGIAGISCAERIMLEDENAEIILVSASSVVKTVTNVEYISKLLTSFDVEETPISEVENSKLQIIVDKVTVLNAEGHYVITESERKIHYSKLCLCNGARPKNPLPFLDDDVSQHVLTIRDTESVLSFQNKLKSARRIAVVGNGGIAAEMVYSLQSVDIIWAIKDEFLVSVFLDPVAGTFFLDELTKSLNNEPSSSSDSSDSSQVTKRMKYTVNDKTLKSGNVGAALGPDWHSRINVTGSNKGKGKSVQVEKEVEVRKIWSANRENSANDDNEPGWNVFIEFSNGSVFGVDFVVSATGVVANGDTFRDSSGLELTETAINVDEAMKTNLVDVYAAGDVCNPVWKTQSPDWFQMRLWTQARQMGLYAGYRMTNENDDVYLDFCFELFTHVTKFFGFNVVLLGLFNGQGLDPKDYEIELRVTPGKELVRIVKVDGRLKGAILIGETELEETFENLILNGIKVDFIDLLDPNIDIGDYFD